MKERTESFWLIAHKGVGIIYTDQTIAKSKKEAVNAWLAVHPTIHDSYKDMLKSRYYPVKITASYNEVK